MGKENDCLRFFGMNQVVLTVLFGLVSMSGLAQNTDDARVVLVMTDGMRWQEVFRGADASLLVPERYFDKRDVSELKGKYLAATPEERRKRLMPFLWGTFVPE